MTIGSMLVYFGILLLLPLWASNRVKKTYQKYSKVRNSSGMTGRDVALKILQDNGLYDVRVEETKGVLSDHYDPRQKVVRLSSDNYHRPYKQLQPCSSRGRTCYPACARLCILAF